MRVLRGRRGVAADREDDGEESEASAAHERLRTAVLEGDHAEGVAT
jgi:hypothetical protein